jgi:hypothetical protein
MLVLAWLWLSSAAFADSVTLGPQLEWWPTAARHQIGPGGAVQYHHVHSWWGIDAELAVATGLERSATAEFHHQFVRGAVLWSVEQGAERIAFQGAIGAALTVRLDQIQADASSYATHSVVPGVRMRLGMGGANPKGIAWRWHMGTTTVQWPRVHFDSGFAIGVGW